MIQGSEICPSNIVPVEPRKPSVQPTNQRMDTPLEEGFVSSRTRNTKLRQAHAAMRSAAPELVCDFCYGESQTMSFDMAASSLRALVLVLVLIKDDLFIKRMLTQKASVYPGFFLMSEVTV